ncbi:MAG: polysaccharide pyruvyl transferase family protein [Pseudobutyrivibrio ruminis]|uniref:Polysaccharide pyruvyl transferase family protein n=1 Tax=Pseudobutyrivibrio ruminis TaxID=46206 RepID=A0A927U7P5_9FIRM|nr:polysaccharide pyruvyl transferase family protein [Pseudobutyrivibrio ruminis]
MKIFIAAHYNLNNGDRALLEATLQILKKSRPDALITVSAVNPEILQDKRYKVVGWPLRNSIINRLWEKMYIDNSFLSGIFLKIFCTKNYLNELADSDIVLVSGGHHLTDLLGEASYYRLASNFSIPQYFGKKVVLLPQSLGPANSNEVKRGIKKILTNAYSIAYRDDASKSFLQSLDITTTNMYVPDLVYSLDIENSNTIKDVVVVALYHSYSRDNKDKLNFTIPNLIKVINELANSGYLVKIVSMDQGDEEYYEEIVNGITPCELRERIIFEESKKNIIDTINIFQEAKFSITYKTHSTIFSMIANVPVVAIAYHRKTNEFMESMDLENYVLDDNEADYESIMKKIHLLLDNYEEYKVMENEGVERNRKKIFKYIRESIEVDS